MSESRIEISTGAGDLDLPMEMCCNCAASSRLTTVHTKLKLSRFLGVGGVEYTYAWRLPFCRDCLHTADRNPVNATHIVLMIGLWTVGLVLAAVIGQTALEKSLFGGHDFWVALTASVVLVVGFYSGSRRPRGLQTSYYQPIRIRKLKQKFTTGEVNGIVVGFTNPAYMRRFQEMNAACVDR